MKRMMIAVVVLLLAGCAAMPTQDEIASLDYGQPISRNDAMAAVKSRASQFLKDPSSAQYDCGNVSTGWVKGRTALGGGMAAGYTMDCAINAKNSFGGYTGAKSYKFIFHDGQIIRVMAYLPDGSMMQAGDF